MYDTNLDVDHYTCGSVDYNNVKRFLAKFRIVTH